MQYRLRRRLIKSGIPQPYDSEGEGQFLGLEVLHRQIDLLSRSKYDVEIFVIHKNVYYDYNGVLIEDPKKIAIKFTNEGRS